MIFKNHLNREFQAEKQNQKFVTDITYVRIGERCAYLSAVLDHATMKLLPGSYLQEMI